MPQEQVTDHILRRIRNHGKGEWVCIPEDFTDLGSRDAVDQALSRLARRGPLRRLARGFYDWPRYAHIIRKLAVPHLECVLDALKRRDQIILTRTGIYPANMLKLTTAVPAKIMFATDGPSKKVMIGGWDITLVHAPPRILYWVNRPGNPVIHALEWLGTDIATTDDSVRILRQVLPDYVKDDLNRARRFIPGWMIPVINRVLDKEGELP